MLHNRSTHSSPTSKNITHLRLYLSFGMRNIICIQILGAGDGNWQTTVTHAHTCIIDDKGIYSHKSSTEPQTAVVYDASGKLKGLIDESHFVPIVELSADKKVPKFFS